MKDTTKLFIWFIVLCAWLLLPGCSTVAPAPIEVKIPVAIKCKTENPVEPVIACYSKDADIFDNTKCLIYEVKVRKAYESELVSALESCK